LRTAQLHYAWWRAANNLDVLFDYSEQYQDELALTDEMEAQARQRGDREQLAAARLRSTLLLVELGRWPEVLARADEADQLQASPWARSLLNTPRPRSLRARQPRHSAGRPRRAGTAATTTTSTTTTKAPRRSSASTASPSTML